MQHDIVTNPQIEGFISQHRLPKKFRILIDEHYAPIVSWLIPKRRAGVALFLGISGAQGTGKSTLADFIRLALETTAGWRVAALSLDDFYLTKPERERLGKDVHPLLKTRGVPGTHDLQLLSSCIDQLRDLDSKRTLPLPRFDKAQDDRAAIETWPVVTGPIDLIILEGWCVGSLPQAPEAVSKPINELERNKDPAGTWRQMVNKCLAEGYAELFAALDFLLLLQAPNFEAACRWRLEQEDKLAAQSADGGAGIMDRAQIAEFMQHYERLTRANLLSLPNIADIVLQLGDNHDCVRSVYATVAK